MTLQIIGAGVGRTGTNSLKLALEQLLQGRCYHMWEAWDRPEDFAVWQNAAEGAPPDWQVFFSGFSATVDAPAYLFWEELAMAFPDAKVLLSYRHPDSWWKSAASTIIPATQRSNEQSFNNMMRALTPRSGMDFFNATETTFKSAYEAHCARVRTRADPARLIEWSPGDGWAPICRALDLPVPEVPFPHVNSTDDFRQAHGME